jgi:hypothetical protein
MPVYVLHICIDSDVLFRPSHLAYIYIDNAPSAPPARSVGGGRGDIWMGKLVVGGGGRAISIPHVPPATRAGATGPKKPPA